MEGQGLSMNDKLADCEDIPLGERMFLIRQLIDAATCCHWDDAELVMSALLEEYRAGPPLPALDDVKDEAEFWSRMATFEEAREYFIATGRRLVRASLGVRGKVKLARRLLGELNPDERKAALDLLAEDLMDRPGPSRTSRAANCAPAAR